MFINIKKIILILPDDQIFNIVSHPPVANLVESGLTLIHSTDLSCPRPICKQLVVPFFISQSQTLID